MPKVPYAGEMIFDDAHDNYFASLEDLEDWLAYCEEEKVVLRLRTCRKIKARKFEVPAFLEPDEESGYTYDYDAAEKLEDHVNSFLEKAQGDIYTPDWQRIDMETLLPLLSEESRSQLDLSLESLPATS
ncbi:MAG: hypothetical protein E6R03_09000 [Hyphomicrobiaceae bacterium]|nr:MAG: hypothetical protein E6R03_09000 [Hyphomicrobiaceae bacterium]